MINVVPWRRQQMHDGLISHPFDSASIAKPENLEEAMTRCNAALTIFTREADPQQWALLHHKLGEIYRKRVIGKRHENLEQALHAYQCALQVRTYDAFPAEYAVTHIALGALYLEMGNSGHRDIFEQALKHYQQALRIFTEDMFPVQWAVSQQGMGYAYLMRREGDNALNVQQAITRGQSSLRILTRAVSPVAWAITHACLGEAYRQATYYETLRERYSGRSVMQEQALRHIAAALQVLTVRQYPLEWAQVQRTLGMLYVDRARGQRDENLAQASSCYEAALQVFSYEFSPVDYVTLQTLLTNVVLLAQRSVMGEG